MVLVFYSYSPMATLLLNSTLWQESGREALAALSLDPSHYAGHSFRIAAATAAKVCSLSDLTIQKLGRWQSSYKLYIHTQRGQTW